MQNAYPAHGTLGSAAVRPRRGWALYQGTTHMGQIDPYAVDMVQFVPASRTAVTPSIALLILFLKAESLVC